MSKFERRKRRGEPAEVLTNKFAASLLDFASEFLKSKPFHHALTKGEVRETPVLKFFNDNLPGTYAICRGEVVDLFEESSPQMDLIIYDQLRNFPFHSGASVILPAEAALVSIEIKSTLTIAEIEKSFKAARKLHSLRPFKQPLSYRRQGGTEVDQNARYFHCVFAYKSDLSASTDYLQLEARRFDDVAAKLGISVMEIDRIYVADRGLLNLVTNFGIPEIPNQGVALLHFYMDILNFLQRENNRREPVPYIAYAGQVGKTNWQRLRNSRTRRNV